MTSLHQRKITDYAQGTVTNAKDLLRKRIPCAEYFFAPKRLWLKQISTHNCDVVVTFPLTVEHNAILWLQHKLQETSGLNVVLRQHPTTHSSAFYISATFPLLLQAAEEYHLPKTLKQSRGGGFKEFLQQDFHCYDLSENELDFFTSEERQWLILRVVNALRAQRYDIGSVAHLKLREGQAIVPRFLSAGLVRQIFPLHDSDALERLQHIWVRELLARQPLDEITEYFGVKIGLYFAWLGHYTAALSIPAVVGVFFWLCCDGKNQTLEDVGYVLFSIFNMVWVTIYLQAWKRYSAELTFRWGTLDQRDDLLAEPRPLFRGELSVSPVTRRLEPIYPSWKHRVFRYFVTVPVIAVCLVTVFCMMIVSFEIQDWWDGFLNVQGLPQIFGILPKLLLALIISMMDEIYFKIALWLNDLENYRLETKYENHLIGKVAVFQFVNSFLSLFYIAFYIQDQTRLKEQLAVLLISRQVLGNLKESALPYLLEHLRLAQMTTSSTTTTPSTERCTISQAELESTLYQYDGTFADYLEMVIQLGYVILFSSAFPLAALCAFINNFVEVRSDAFKLTYVCQRSFGQRVPNIGTWQNCMEYISMVAVLVNCGLIGLSGQVHRVFPEMTATQTILLIVCLEHIMLVIRFVIQRAIPDVPGWLATEMAKIEWARREASKTTVAPSNKRTASITVDSIQSIPPYRPRKTSGGQQMVPPQDSNYHLTIGPSGGIEWTTKNTQNSNDIHKSAECISTLKEASSSDSDLLYRGSSIIFAGGGRPPTQSPPPTPTNGGGGVLPPPLPPPPQPPTAVAPAPTEDFAAKKTRVKQSLLKRARSVAIFSLKLKERRAREAAATTKGAVTPITTPQLPPPQLGGELACIPIEKKTSPTPSNNNQQQRSSQDGLF